MADLDITPANFLPSDKAIKEIGKAGVAIAIGQLLYYHAASQSWKLAAGTVLAASFVKGISASAAAVGQPVIVVTEDEDLTVGASLNTSYPVYVLSANAGGIAQVNDLGAGSIYPNVVLIGTSATKCIFKPGVLRGKTATIAD